MSSQPKLPCGCPAEMSLDKTHWLHNPGCKEAKVAVPKDTVAPPVAPSPTSPPNGVPPIRWSKIFVNASNENGFVQYEETYEGPLDETYRKLKTQSLRNEADWTLHGKVPKQKKGE
jgi:hypothetical protein